jgi:hypothetical protein
MIFISNQYREYILTLNKTKSGFYPKYSPESPFHMHFHTYQQNLQILYFYQTNRNFTLYTFFKNCFI